MNEFSRFFKTQDIKIYYILTIKKLNAGIKKNFHEYQNNEILRHNSSSRYEHLYVGNYKTDCIFWMQSKNTQREEIQLIRTCNIVNNTNSPQKKFVCSYSDFKQDLLYKIMIKF